MSRPAVLITTDAVGGVWTYSLAVAGGFAQAGWRVVLAVLGPAPDAARIRAARGIAGCTLVQTGWGLDWTASDAAGLHAIADGLAQLAGRQCVSSAHLHAPCLAEASWRMPVAAVVHSCIASWWEATRGVPLPPELAFHAALTAKGMARADASIAPSRAFAAALARVHGVNAPQVIHNGACWPHDSGAARQNFILTAGRLWDEGKNIETLNRAAQRLGTPVRAAGPLHGPNATSVELGNLEHLGNLSAPVLRATMARAALFAAPSRYEPFGLAVLEAAQTGAPLVLADIPTLRELWSGAALFLPPGDAALWARALDWLMRSPIRRAALGRAARARAASYSLAQMTRATVGVHAGLIGKRRLAA